MLPWSWLATNGFKVNHSFSKNVGKIRTMNYVFQPHVVMKTETAIEKSH